MEQLCTYVCNSYSVTTCVWLYIKWAHCTYVLYIHLLCIQGHLSSLFKYCTTFSIVSLAWLSYTLPLRQYCCSHIMTCILCACGHHPFLFLQQTGVMTSADSLPEAQKSNHGYCISMQVCQSTLDTCMLPYIISAEWRTYVCSTKLFQYSNTKSSKVQL